MILLFVRILKLCRSNYERRKDIRDVERFIEDKTNIINYITLFFYYFNDIVKFDDIVTNAYLK